MAATAPQIDMNMIRRVLATGKKSTKKAVHREQARLVALAHRRRAPGPVPTPELIRLPDEADADLVGRWATCTAALSSELRMVIDLAEEGMELPETAAYLGIPLVTVWDRCLEATAAVLEAAGLPIVNRWLEEQLKKNGVLPEGTSPFTCDIGWMMCHQPSRMRETAYARICCRGVDVPAVWGVKVPTFNNRLCTLKRVFRRYAIAAGALTVPANVDKIGIWIIANSIDLGVGSTLMYATAESVGLPPRGEYTWAEAKLIWDSAVGSAAYKRAILQPEVADPLDQRVG